MNELIEKYCNQSTEHYSFSVFFLLNYILYFIQMFITTHS